MDLTTEYKPTIEAAAPDRTESAVCESDLKGSTAVDMQHMERMGKQQQL